MKIEYLINTDIDRSKWDKCISLSVNGMIYAYTWYLDIVSPHWEALIFNNYETVMPLTYRKKYGIYYLYQPFFTQQLGVFSNNAINPDVVETFLKAIPKKFKFVEINLNVLNNITSDIFAKKAKITHHLDLISPYKKLFLRFNDNTKRNLKKAQNNKISIREKLNINDFINFYAKENQDSKSGLQSFDFATLKNLIHIITSMNFSEIIGAFTEENLLCAASVWFRSNQKIIYLAGASNEKGIEYSAMFAIINHVIQKHAGKNCILDFEGSNIEGVARFFQGFGATPIEYFQIKKNSLPWFMKLFKK